MVSMIRIPTLCAKKACPLLLLEVQSLPKGLNRSLKIPGIAISTKSAFTMSTTSSSWEAYHEHLKPLSWLLGKWRSDCNMGKGQYPTIKDFQYEEIAEFCPVGMKPAIEYSLHACHPTSKVTLHKEIGFIRIKPDSNKISFTASHILGVAETQEGEVTDQTLTVETTVIARNSFTFPVKKICRTFTLKGDKLEQVMGMETERTPMTEHCRVAYDMVKPVAEVNLGIDN